MADRIIDYDRGVIINSHAQTGMDIFMYVDEPGKFLTAHGHVVPDAIAGEAGYDVERLSKERLRQERKAQASKIIDQELSDETKVTEKIVKARNGFQLVSFGLGRHNIKDPEGNVLNVHPLPLETADKLFQAMAGDEVKKSGISK